MPIPAYLDTLEGLIPCQALRLHPTGRDILLKFRSPRAKALGFIGEQCWPLKRAVPRERVQRSGYGSHWVRPYDWELLLPNQWRVDTQRTNP